MIPAQFDYVRAGSIEEAIRLLERHGDEAKLLAGGHSLIPAMKLRLATPATLIDIGAIPALDKITVAGGKITLGALARHAAVAASAELERNAPVLWDAANEIGDPQVRNRGTIGGAAVHGDPAADYPAALLALDATFTVAGKGGERTIPAGEFFEGLFTTAVRSGEVLTAISFAPAPRSAYVKYHHPASHYAVVGAAAVLELDGETIRSARIGLTGIGDTAYRAGAVEKALVGVRASDAAALKRACAGAAAGVDARSDTFASATYRAAMAEVYAARAVARAASR